MKQKSYLHKRYSIFIKPISIIANLVIINWVLYHGLDDRFYNPRFFAYINLGWLVVSYHVKFYNIHRYIKVFELFSGFLLQISLFSFVYFAYFGLTGVNVDVYTHLKILAFIAIGIALFRTLYLFLLKRYRAGGKNFRNIILIGHNKTTRKITEYINKHPELGYRILGFFSNKPVKNSKYLGTIDDSFEFMKNNVVDQIYCSIEDLDKKQIEHFISFADNNLKILKLLPDANDAYTTKTEVEYIDYIPVLSLRRIPLNDTVNQLFKRLFDIVFSLFIFIFILSWLTPLLYILIKMESNGPLFFKQIRNGLNGEDFTCYKFRSMRENDKADIHQAIKDDVRVTRTGRFLRKFSIDELPQFYNVLKGEMSTVGPRPHMLSQTEKYAPVVDKFMVRHFVKPGITGLAQISGYRGEVETKRDMENRIRLDIFYIENWSFLLDLKIILQTVFNIIKGEEKAY